MNLTRLIPERVCSGAQRLAVEVRGGEGRGGRGAKETREQLTRLRVCVSSLYSGNATLPSVVTFVTGAINLY